jgi:type IV secretion system protein VirB9
MKRALMLFLLWMPSTHAESIPSPGPQDARVKVVQYDPLDVVRIVGHYGYSTQVQFAPDEFVPEDGIAMGDSLAWVVAPKGNHLFLKPTEPKAQTNLQVVTNKRVYQFDLAAKVPTPKEKPADMYYFVVFVYAEEEARRTADSEIADTPDVEALLAAASSLIPPPSNRDYWARGSASIRPVQAFDDGRFTYFEFRPGSKMPAVFSIAPDGTESVANRHMSDGFIVVHELAERFVLRLGRAVVCIENRAYDGAGRGTANGAASPVIERTLKAVQP